MVRLGGRDSLGRRIPVEEVIFGVLRGQAACEDEFGKWNLPRKNFSIAFDA
jgi:hypothetical protein